MRIAGQRPRLPDTVLSRAVKPVGDHEGAGTGAAERPPQGAGRPLAPQGDAQGVGAREPPAPGAVQTGEQARITSGRELVDNDFRQAALGKEGSGADVGSYDITPRATAP